MDREGRRTNILFVLPQISTGGTERVVLDLARRLNKSLFGTFVAFFQSGVLEKDFRRECDGVFQLSKKKGFDIGTMLHLAGIIRSWNIHVVNAHHYMPFFYSYLGTRILKRKRLIYTEHSVAEVERISGLHEDVFNLLLRDTSVVIGVSKEISDAFRTKFRSNSGKFICIPNGVDVEKFTGEADRESMRTELGLKSDDFIIGNVANFRKVKNHACLVRAFHMTNRSYPRSRLVLVGRGFPGDDENTEEAIRGLVHSHGLERKVIFVGYREDIPRLLKGFDVFCLTSFSEGLPISILEAMAAKVPVVGSNVRGIREVLNHEKTGLLFPCNDSVSLTGLLGRLIADPKLCSSIVTAAFNEVSQKHGISNWVSEYEKIFSWGQGLSAA